MDSFLYNASGENVVTAFKLVFLW